MKAFEAASVDIPNAAAPSPRFPRFGIPPLPFLCETGCSCDGRHGIRDRELILQIRRSFVVPPPADALLI